MVQKEKQIWSRYFGFSIQNCPIAPRREKSYSNYINNTAGLTRARRIIDYDNMDYLKLKNGKYNNGSVPTDINLHWK